MNHELIMLRELKRMRKLSQSLTKEVKFRAVKSYASATVKDGTMGQIEEICRLTRLRDDCLLFCDAVAEAVKSVNKSNRALLVGYYLKGISVGEIAQRLNVTVNNVYGKLFAARLQLRSALNKLGYDEQWLRERFSHIDFIADRLKTPHPYVK